MRGLLWLSRRETLRVSKLWTQTVLAPVVSSMLFILVFGLSLSGRISGVADVLDDGRIIYAGGSSSTGLQQNVWIGQVP